MGNKRSTMNEMIENYTTKITEKFGPEKAKTMIERWKAKTVPYLTAQDQVRQWLDERDILPALRTSYLNFFRQVWSLSTRYLDKTLEREVSALKEKWLRKGLDREIMDKLSAFVLKRPWEKKE